MDTNEYMEELNTKVCMVKNALKRAMSNNLVEIVARSNRPSEHSPPKQTNLHWITFGDIFQAAVAADSNQTSKNSNIWELNLMEK